MRATPDLLQQFTGVTLPKIGPRQMGTDAEGKTSVITFLNQVTESIESLHDNGSDVRPSYLPVNGLWCFTDAGGGKTVYQYMIASDGPVDVALWEIAANGKLSILNMQAAAVGVAGIIEMASTDDLESGDKAISPQWIADNVDQDGGGYTAREVITTGKTWAVPKKGTYLFALTGGGGPGGSGAASSAGGAGATITHLVPLEENDQVVITIGSGGIIGVSGGGETKIVVNGQTYTAGGGGAGIANSGGGYAGGGGGGGLSGTGGLGSATGYGAGGSGAGMNNGGAGGYYVGSPGGGGFNASGGGTGQVSGLTSRGGAAMNLHGTGSKYGFGGDSNANGQPGCVVIMY